MTRTLGGLAAWIVGGTALASLGRAQDPPPFPDAPPVPAGAQVLTRGPVHEAYAGPIVYDPRPGPIVPKAPPGPIEETPPDQSPEGTNIRWIPGYWAYDDERQDFLWISGIWRDVPPGRQWVPGYWSEAEGGYRWVPGAWLPIDQADNLQYLPEPPASLEAGPDSAPPAEDAVWAPGIWVWQEGRYQWRPGYWVEPQPHWTWVPAHYTSTPNGYLFTEGYWDRPFDSRGQLFTPVAFSQPVYNQPGFRYQPNVGLLASGLMTSLFVRPSHGQYYFGDYYASNYASSGIYPWYAYHQSRYGYDPVYSYYAANQRRTSPDWDDRLRQSYLYRRDHEDARPPRSYAEMARGVPGQAPYAGVGDVSNMHNVAFARPFAQIASTTGSGNPLRFGRVDEGQARGFVDQGRQLRDYGLDRSRREAGALAGRDRPAVAAAEQPRRLEMPRSPIVAQHPGPGRPAEASQREAMRPAFPAAEGPRPNVPAERPREPLPPAVPPGGPPPPREAAPVARAFAPPHIPPAAPALPRPQAAPQPPPNHPSPRPEPHFEVDHSPHGYPQSIAGRPLPPAPPPPVARPVVPPPATPHPGPPPQAKPGVPSTPPPTPAPRPGGKPR